MLYAQILNGVIQNIIVLDDVSLIPLFPKGFDYFIRVDDLNPQPCVDWVYDGTNFTPGENT